MLAQPEPLARQKYCWPVEGITVRAHSRSQKVENSLSFASLWLGQAHAAPGWGAGAAACGGSFRTGAGSSSRSSPLFDELELLDAVRVLVDVRVDVEDFDEEVLELDELLLAVVVVGAAVVVGVGAAVVLV